MVILEILKNGSFGKLFEKWNFGKLNLKIGTLENYFKNGILENFKKLEFWKIKLKIGVLKIKFKNWNFGN